MMKHVLRLAAIGVGTALSVVVLYAAASYPSAVKSFTTKLDGPGKTVFAAHINDLQDEVVAIEGALLNGFAHALKPTVAGAQNLGSAALPWGTLYVNSIVGGGATESCGLRLTLTSGTPITTADVTAATSVYVSPITGGQCAFYDGSTTWTMLTNAEVSIAVPATTNTLYDVFCFNNSGTMACDAAVAWTNDTTRATALTTQNAVYVKTGATTRRYMGSFRTTTVSGQTEDSLTKRYVWSYYHRVPRALVRQETTDTWPYTLAVMRQANGSTANQVDVVIGVAEVTLELDLRVVALNTNAAVQVVVGIGEDSTTTALAIGTGGLLLWAWTPAANTYVIPSAAVRKMPAVGRHFYAWLEYSAATGTTTWIGDNSTPLLSQSGLVGSLGP